MESSHYLLAACATLALASSASAQAQAAQAQTAGQATTDNAGIPDIIVTATRDKSKESKTPISMEVYSGSALAEKGIASIQSLATSDSSLNINAGGGEPILSLRGIESTNTTEVGDPAVLVSNDGMFNSRSYALNAGMFDINRVEVLRGPQGTLFGRNVVGGLVNIITNDPTDKFGGYADAEYGDYNTVNLGVGVNIPLSDTLQVRVSGQTRSHDGYRNILIAPTNTYAGGDNENDKAGRIKLNWEPAPNLKIGLEYSHTYVNDTGITEEENPFALNPAAGGTPGATTNPNVNNVDLVPPVNGTLNRNVMATGSPTSFALNFLPNERIREDAYHWNAVYTLAGGQTVSYIGSWDDMRWSHLSVQSSVAPNPLGNPNEALLQNEHPQTLNQELRIASAQGKQLTWQAGVFYFNEHNSIYSPIFFDYGNQGASGVFGGPPQQVQLLVFDYPHVNSASIAGYGQASYAVTSDVKLTGGLRYTSDHKNEVGGCNLFTLFGTPSTCPAGSQAVGRSSSGELTYHFGIDWQANPRTLIYAHGDKGYKAGGFNTADSTTYKPETLYSYELGAKTRLADGHVTLNAALFYEDYLNQQVFQQLSGVNGTSVASDTVNAGKSHIYGLELGSVASAPGAGRFDLNLTYLHARYVNFQVLDQGPNGVTSQLDGNTPADSPTLSATAGYEYSIPAFGGSITPRVDGRYQTKRYLTIYDTPDGTQDANLVANASLRFEDSAKRFTLEFYVRNLTNKTVIVDFNEQNATKLYQTGFAPPRTYGARLHMNF